MPIVSVLRQCICRKVTCCKCDIESHNNIYLTDNHLRIMPGGVPHWVMGTSNAMCVGRHFYSASAIRSSVIAIIHTFLLNGAVTNQNYQESRTLLYQLLVFWSLRLDKTDVDGVFNLYKQRSTSNLATSQEHISRTCPLKRDFLISYTSEYLSSSPLRLTTAFILTANLHPPLSKR
jgi:hypothetical protein